VADVPKRFADNRDDRSFDWASLSSRAGVERESRCRPTKDGVAPLFEIAFVLVRFDHFASVIVNADDSLM
jgi:hypothetical protein